MEASRKFSIKFLKSVLYGDQDGAEIIVNKIVDTSRWAVQYELVFKYEDIYYQTYYSRGATEMQDEAPWEYDSDPVIVAVVVPVEVTVIQYKSVQKEVS